MKNRVMIAVWFLATLMWTTFGLLYLLRLHYLFTGAILLVLGALSLFIALRFWKQAAAEQAGVTPPPTGLAKPRGS